MAEFDEYQKAYENTINDSINYTGKSRDYFTKVKAKYLVRLLDSHFGERRALNILDIGCGNAIIHPFLMEQRPDLRLTGADVAPTLLDEAREVCPQVRYDLYDGKALPYAAGQFDAAYAICVMHHVPPPQWRDFLDRARHVVKPGGLVAIFEHNPINPLTQRLVNTCPFDRNAVLLRAGRLKGLMRDSGLSEVSHRFILFTPFEGAFFDRFDQSLGWLPLGAQYFAAGRVPG